MTVAEPFGISINVRRFIFIPNEPVNVACKIHQCVDFVTNNPTHFNYICLLTEHKLSLAVL